MIDPRAALDAIGQLPDGEIDLASAALQLARIDAPDANWEAAATHLSDLARDAVLVASDIAPQDISAQAGALAALLAGQQRYAGDSETYDDPANANLVQVMERRRGLPVALGILWMHCARAAGWEVYGIDFPGHFLVALSAGGIQTLLDVFAGGAPVDIEDLRVMIKRVEGPGADLRPGLLQPMRNREILLRLQNNIKTRRLAQDDVAGALACAEDMLRFAPETAALWREAAVLHQQLDQVAAALRCFERFLKLVRDGDAAARVRTIMDELRTRLN